MTRAPFSRYGGKYYMLNDILPLLPPHDVWVECFGGAAWVTLAKEPAPVEVINDLDEGIVNFYRVLRDPALFPQLAAALEMTPYARSELVACRSSWTEQADPVEKARRWYVTVRQAVVGKVGISGWSYTRTSSNIPSRRWAQSIEALDEVHARLRLVQIEQRDWRILLDNWDQPETMLYADPPYVHATRSGGHGYAHEMTDDDHRALVVRLLAFRGRVLLSGYAHPIYTPLEGAGWRRIDIATVAHSTGSTKSSQVKQARIESLWLNYDPAALRGQRTLFSEISA